LHHTNLGFRATGITDALARKDIIERKLKNFSVDGGINVQREENENEDDEGDFLHLEEEDGDNEDDEFV
jgi:hypothetical protein